MEEAVLVSLQPKRLDTMVDYVPPNAQLTIRLKGVYNCNVIKVHYFEKSKHLWNGACYVELHAHKPR